MIHTLRLYLRLGYLYWFNTAVSHCKLLPINTRIVAEMNCITILMEYAKVKFNLNLEGDNECAT